mgnify:FL=1
MIKMNKTLSAEGVSVRRGRQPLSDSSFLLTITISMFIAIYALAIAFLGDKGFSKLQMFFNLFNENAALIVIACGLTIVMI